MSVFKSAMGYFSSGGANGGSDNDFVGQFVEIGNMKLRVKKVIAEGMQSIYFSFQHVNMLRLQYNKITCKGIVHLYVGNVGGHEMGYSA